MTWDGTNPISCSTGVTVSGGNVGIGTTAPGANLDVGGLNSTQANGSSNYQAFFGSDGNAGWGGVLLGYGGNGNTPFVGSSKDGNGNVLPLTFQTGGTERIRILAGGNVGIGTTSPQATLDVIGEVRPGTTGVGCSSTNEGAIRYNSSLHTPEVCSCPSVSNCSWINIGSAKTFYSFTAADMTAGGPDGQCTGSYNTNTYTKNISVTNESIAIIAFSYDTTATNGTMASCIFVDGNKCSFTVNQYSGYGPDGSTTCLADLTPGTNHVIEIVGVSPGASMLEALGQILIEQK